MNFEQVIRQLQDTELLMAEIEQRQAEARKFQAESIGVHEQRMAHIDMRLSSITCKLGLMGGYFKGTQ